MAHIGAYQFLSYISNWLLRYLIDIPFFPVYLDLFGTSAILREWSSASLPSPCHLSFCTPHVCSLTWQFYFLQPCTPPLRDHDPATDLPLGIKAGGPGKEIREGLDTLSPWSFMLSGPATPLEALPPEALLHNLQKTGDRCCHISTTNLRAATPPWATGWGLQHLYGLQLPAPPDQLKVYTLPDLF